MPSAAAEQASTPCLRQTHVPANGGEPRRRQCHHLLRRERVKQMDDRHPSCKPIGTSACPNRHARASRGKSSIDSTGRRTIEMLAAQHAKPNAQEPKRLQASKNSAYTRQTQRVSPRMPAAIGGEPVADRSAVYGLCHSRYRARLLRMHPALPAPLHLCCHTPGGGSY